MVLRRKTGNGRKLNADEKKLAEDGEPNREGMSKIKNVITFTEVYWKKRKPSEDEKENMGEREKGEMRKQEEGDRKDEIYWKRKKPS